MSTGLRDLDPYDAVVLLSFGGPQGPEDVIPFLENVTAGRGIPRERLAEVGEHYHLFNGVSPINAQNSALTTALRTELARRGIATPVYLGNRNWRPSLVDALRQAGADGARRILAVTTSAYSSYSGCRQYREDVATAIAELATEGTVVQVDQVRRYFNIPGFVQANVDAATRAWYEVLDDPADLLDIAGEDWPRLVFVTHSIPIGMQETSGPGGGQYVRQHLSLADRIADLLAEHFGRPIDYDLVFCSRSGPPQVPWLEPDVNDHLQDLAQQGQRRVVLAPIGFISDHMEVAYDLDVEARATAAEHGVRIARASTAGTDAAFVAGLVDLLVERAIAERTGTTTTGGPAPPASAFAPLHDVCGRGCCPNLRADKPAACGHPDEMPLDTVSPTG